VKLPDCATRGETRESLGRIDSKGGQVIHPNEVLGELREPAHELREHIPDVIGAYAEMQRAAMADGALTAKTKELIALAVAVTRECDGCIASHARGAARRGASESEVAEALGVAVLLNGGPGTVWAPRALAAFRELAGPPES
jgi:AhpD family alkylhydroperoxidase